MLLPFASLLAFGAALVLGPATRPADSRLLFHERTALRGEGRSMLPTLPESCRMALVRVPFAEVRAGPTDGDVITVRVNGKSITHRAVRRLPDGRIVTWGDNNPRPDPTPIAERNYVAVVVGFENPARPGELALLASRPAR